MTVKKPEPEYYIVDKKTMDTICENLINSFPDIRSIPCVSPDRILELPVDTLSALDSYAKAERKKFSDPDVARMVTAKSIAQHILANELEKQGYLDRRGKRVKK